ncbi:hypothetical protein OJAV_G00034430 [Oryzias javanicus]|uniref:Immunoglobulin V-set domain-containing protein n=1 Tax=Oryzias javanicus TaxID=123683 RepID=A0A437DG15_ORYJA|nr:hypothetical protein OJAV_G00034430 [Oryzias javanicus]
MARPLLQTFLIITCIQNLDAARHQSLTCNVTKQNDRSIKYQIFGKPSSTGYDSSWEKKDSIVIVAINSQYNKSVVKSLKNDSVELYVCEDFLCYNMQIFEKDGTCSKLTAACKVNCTCLMNKDSPPVNNGFPEWGIACIVLGLTITIVLGTVILRFFWKKVCCESLFQNNRTSQMNGPQSSQPQIHVEADGIMVPTDASPFLPERSDPEVVKMTPLCVCNGESR